MHLSAVFLTSAFAVTTLAGTLQITTCSNGDGNGTAFPSGSQCTAECSISRPGGDYTNIDFGSKSNLDGYAACAQACSQDPKCLTAQYRNDNKFCYLKASIGVATANSNVNGVLCRTCAQGELVPGTTCRQECGIDRPGNDIDQIRIPGPNALQDCARACARNPACLNANYVPGNSFCYLKGRTNAPVELSAVNGVVCRTAGSTATA